MDTNRYIFIDVFKHKTSDKEVCLYYDHLHNDWHMGGIFSYSSLERLSKFHLDISEDTLTFLILKYEERN